MLNFATVNSVVPLWANFLFLRDCFVRRFFWHVACLLIALSARYSYPNLHISNTHLVLLLERSGGRSA